MKKLFLINTILFAAIAVFSQNIDSTGMYFSKTEYNDTDIPVFEDSKRQLPIPILEDDPELVDMYWKCWEIAFNHFKKPPEGSPFVSNILDEAFNDNVFQWDMIFMVMFARYGHDIFPAVNSLDNFYSCQHPSGYICREISEKDGSDFVFMGRKHTINPPLFSWAEMESFKNTGDISRFEMVLPVLKKYVEWLNKDGNLINANDEDNWFSYGRKSSSSTHQLFWNTGLGSGMDNTPREGSGWVDMSCQMVIQYNNLAEMCTLLGKEEDAKRFREEAESIGKRINQYCWNDEDGLYYDVDSIGNQIKWKTTGCFWPMLAGIASQEQCDRLAEHLQDTSSFWRYMVFPTLAADQEGYDPKGDYWKGGVWAPTNYMIIKGLELNGYDDLATKASMNYLKGMYCVFEDSQTVWENYSPDTCDRGYPAKPDFVGWTGIGPIALLIENIIGLRISAVDSTITWRISRTDKHGIQNLKLGDVTLDLLCEKRDNHNSPIMLTVTADSDIHLFIISEDINKELTINKGTHEIVVE